MLATTSRAEMLALARIADSLATSEDGAEVPEPDFSLDPRMLSNSRPGLLSGSVLEVVCEIS
jgi:hypothetical protein